MISNTSPKPDNLYKATESTKGEVVGTVDVRNIE